MSALVVQAAAALAIVAALLFARRSLRQGRSPDGAVLEIAARRALGRDSGVAIVRWDGAELLVGYGSGGVRLLARSGAEAAGELP